MNGIHLFLIYLVSFIKLFSKLELLSFILFFKVNVEKLILYISIGVLLSIIYILSILAIKQCLQRRNLLKRIDSLHEAEEALEFDNSIVPNRVKQQQQQQLEQIEQANLMQQQQNQVPTYDNHQNYIYNTNKKKANIIEPNYDLDTSNFENFKLITKNGSTKIVNGTSDNLSEYEIPIIRYNDRMMQQYSNNY